MHGSLNLRLLAFVHDELVELLLVLLRQVLQLFGGLGADAQLIHGYGVDGLEAAIRGLDWLQEVWLATSTLFLHPVSTTSRFLAVARAFLTSAGR